MKSKASFGVFKIHKQWAKEKKKVSRFTNLDWTKSVGHQRRRITLGNLTNTLNILIA
jgi:hypothetical protein